MRDYFKIETYTKASTIPLAFSLASATGQLPAGWFADRFGPTPLIIIGTLGVAVAGVLVGLSPNFVMLLVFLIESGLGLHQTSIGKRKRGCGIDEVVFPVTDLRS